MDLKSCKIVLKDVFVLLREENHRLLNELSFERHLNTVLDKMRKVSKDLKTNCNCVENSDSFVELNELEIDYKLIKAKHKMNKKDPKIAIQTKQNSIECKDCFITIDNELSYKSIIESEMKSMKIVSKVDSIDENINQNNSLIEEQNYGLYSDIEKELNEENSFERINNNIDSNLMESKTKIEDNSDISDRLFGILLKSETQEFSKTNENSSNNQTIDSFKAKNTSNELIAGNEYNQMSNTINTKSVIDLTDNRLKQSIESNNICNENIVKTNCNTNPIEGNKTTETLNKRQISDESIETNKSLEKQRKLSINQIESEDKNNCFENEFNNKSDINSNPTNMGSKSESILEINEQNFSSNTDSTITQELIEENSCDIIANIVSINDKYMDSSDTESNPEYQTITALSKSNTENNREFGLITELMKNNSNILTQNSDQINKNLIEGVIQHNNDNNLIDLRCYECDYSFKSDHMLEKHINKKHKNIKPYVCHICTDQFYTEELKLKHLSGDHLIPAFECQFCDFKTLIKNSLILHNTRHSAVKSFKCDIKDCYNAFRSKANLYMHKKFKHPLNMQSKKHFICDWPQCNSLFKSRQLLLNHQMFVHKTHTFVCRMSGCDYMCNSYVLLFEHKQTHIKAHKCPKDGCNQLFTLKLQLDRHLSDRHKTENSYQTFVTNETKEYDCVGESDNSFISKDIRHKEIIQLSDECTDSSDTESDSDYERNVKNRHKTKHSLNERNSGLVATNEQFIGGTDPRISDKLFESQESTTSETQVSPMCMECEEQFETELEFELHMNSFHKLKCDECEQSLKSQLDLEIHMISVHKSFKPFVCLKCDNEFYSKENFTNHLNIIHNISESVDDSSQSSYSDSSTSSTKSIEEQYMCQIDDCPNVYSTKASLYQHKRLKHNISISRQKAIEYTTRNTYFLQNNSSLQTTVGQYVCQWPGCVFNTDSIKGYTNHRNRHKKSQDFKCNWAECGKQFKSKQLLNSHLNRHKNKCRYVCRWPGCQYSSANKSDVSRHLTAKHITIKQTFYN